MPYELAALGFTLFWGCCAYMEFGYRYKQRCLSLPGPEHLARYGKGWEEDSVDLSIWGPIGLIYTFFTGAYKAGRLYPWSKS